MKDFLVIPAVDIKDGRCVRLLRGKAEDETVFADDPLEVAVRWWDEGARLLHLVDLDGAFTGEPVHRDVIREIAKTVNVPVQVGGGVRDKETAEWYLDAGISRVILGTAALEGPILRELSDRYPGRVVLGLDVKGGSVAVKGWTGAVDISPLSVAERAAEAGVERLVYTDVSRDGTLEGPDVEGIEALARATDMKVIASGGVSSIEDVVRISRLHSAGVEGAIVGMALYRGRFSLREAVEKLSSKE